MANHWTQIIGFSGCKSQFVLPQKSFLQISSFNSTFKFRIALRLLFSMGTTSTCCFWLTRLPNRSSQSHRQNSQSGNVVFRFQYRCRRLLWKRYSNLLGAVKLSAWLSLASANCPTQKWTSLNTRQTCLYSIRNTSQAWIGMFWLHFVKSLNFARGFYCPWYPKWSQLRGLGL